MKRTQKRGFTIVELVIVIAVIAILAAVLIPTFSSLISKANLSADMQAVREMNIALAADEAVNGKPTTIEGAMKVIADAGYDVDSWSPISKGYQVYWYKIDNRCVLYSTEKAAVEFPKEYSGKSFATDREFASNVYVYNQTFKNATEMNFAYDDSSLTGTVTVGSKSYANAVIAEKKGSGDTYACVIVQKGNDNQKKYIVTVEAPASPNAEELAAAQKAAGEYVYSLFVQMDLDKVDESSAVEFAPGTTVDVSELEWNPIELFSGYFGTSDDSDPVVIKGLKLTNATGYAATYKFLGNGSMYYCSGFFGAIYGNATIENVKFVDVDINTPAMDAIIIQPGKNSNTTALIGGIVRPEGADGATNVKIRNVTAENCNITGAARTAGLIGYIGGYKSTVDGVEKIIGLTGSVKIENCSFSGTVTSKLNTNTYGTAAGLIGFIDKLDKPEDLTIEISDSKVAGKIEGYEIGAIATMRTAPGSIVLKNVDISGVELKLNSSTGNCSSATILNVRNCNGKIKIVGAGVKMNANGDALSDENKASEDALKSMFTTSDQVTLTYEK